VLAVHGDLGPGVVTFPRGDVTARSTITAVLVTTIGPVVVTRETPFHPEDPWWPDQPSDSGRLDVAGEALPVPDTVLVVRGADGNPSLLVDGSQAPDRSSTALFVGHRLDADLAEPARLLGVDVELAVDTRIREGLSVAHSRSHLFALALNAALVPFWRKDVQTDSLGAPDFDKLAIQDSRITPGSSCEQYRLGKSLRRKGFDVAGAMVEAPVVLAQAVATANAWVARALPMRVACPNGATVGDRRVWQCALPEGEVSIPCGGTHVSSTADIGAVAVDHEWDPETQKLCLTLRAADVTGLPSTDEACLRGHGDVSRLRPPGEPGKPWITKPDDPDLLNTARPRWARPSAEAAVQVLDHE
jgi:alanyl-tRNA synthetase